jgi:hypothetical protein
MVLLGKQNVECRIHSQKIPERERNFGGNSRAETTEIAAPKFPDF